MATRNNLANDKSNTNSSRVPSDELIKSELDRMDRSNDARFRAAAEEHKKNDDFIITVIDN